MSTDKLNIDTLQVKRILTDTALNNHKEYKLNSGEMLWVGPDVDIRYPAGCLLIGHGGDDTLMKYLDDPTCVWLPYSHIYSQNDTGGVQHLEMPTTSNSTVEFTDKNNAKLQIKLPSQEAFNRVYLKGESTEFARVDHKHPITREDVWNILDVNTAINGQDNESGLFTCRRIMCGKELPGDNTRITELCKLYNVKVNSKTKKPEQGDLSDAEYKKLLDDWNCRPKAGDIYIRIEG